jgi:hypothetical protein
MASGVKIGVTVKNDRVDAVLREVSGLTKLSFGEWATVFGEPTLS